MTRRPGWRAAVPLAAAAVIWMLPHDGFSVQAWGLLCLYAATVCALITRPMPAGSVMVVAATTGTLLHLFTIQEALSGYGNVTVWLIVFVVFRAFSG